MIRIVYDCGLDILTTSGFVAGNLKDSLFVTSITGNGEDVDINDCLGEIWEGCDDSEILDCWDCSCCEG